MANGELVSSTIKEIVKFYGPAGAVAVVLFAALIGWIPSPVQSSLEILKKQTEIQEANQKEIAGLRQEMQSAVMYQNMLLRTICRGIVTKEYQTQCEPYYRGYKENGQR